MDSAVKGDFRLLVLVLSLANAPLTKQEIFTLVPGYEHSDLMSAERMFARDKLVLKDLGIELEVVPNRAGEPTYHAQFPKNWLHLNADERSLLHAASALWYDVSDWGDDLELFKFKVSAYALANPASMRAMVAGGRLAVQLLTAMEAKQVISFRYQKRASSQFSERQVYPIRMVFEAGALYIHGFDFARSELRMFKLQRFYPDSVVCEGPLTALQVEQVAGVYESVNQLEATARQLVSPRLWVREDYLEQAAGWLLTDGSSVSSAGSVFSEGGYQWPLLIGKPAPFTVWLERVMSAPDIILVAEPTALAELVRSRLKAGTHLGQVSSGF